MDKKLIRHDWQIEQATALLYSPFNDLVFEAQSIFREYFNPNSIQLSTLVNINSGGCPEDCAYCPQSIRYQTGVETSKMSMDEFRQLALEAKKSGAGRFCMGAAWRRPKDHDLDRVSEMIGYVNELGMESCVTLGMLSQSQAQQLKGVGLAFYNHNLDCSETFYETIITSREYQDRLETLGHVREAGIKVCSGGIIGMGETVKDRAELLVTLANFSPQPESVPINLLVKVKGTPLGDVQSQEVDALDFVRVIATARIMLPASYIRLSAGRKDMGDEYQALCFLAGANSVFYGNKLLTTDNPEITRDQALFQRLGLTAYTGLNH